MGIVIIKLESVVHGRGDINPAPVVTNVKGDGRDAYLA